MNEGRNMMLALVLSALVPFGGGRIPVPGAPYRLDGFGSRLALKQKLDEYFASGANDHSNEPSHHVPYLYAAIGFSVVIEALNQLAGRNVAREEALVLPVQAGRPNEAFAVEIGADPHLDAVEEAHQHQFVGPAQVGGAHPQHGGHVPAIGELSHVIVAGGVVRA